MNPEGGSYAVMVMDSVCIRWKIIKLRVKLVI